LLRLLLVAGTATPALDPLSLHDALPICYSALGRLHFVDMAADSILQQALGAMAQRQGAPSSSLQLRQPHGGTTLVRLARIESDRDRKSTRLNSSHVKISYAVFCLKKKTR